MSVGIITPVLSLSGTTSTGITASMPSNPPTSITQAGTNVSEGTLATSNAGTVAIPKGSIGTVGWLKVKNLDGAISIDLLAGSGGTAFCTLAPGEEACFKPKSGLAICVESASGTPTLQYLWFEL